MLLLLLSNGASNGWNSPSIPTLMDATKTPLASGALSQDEGSWVAANIGIGSIVGAPVFGWLIAQFGCKVSAYLSSVLQLVAWFCIVLAQNHYYLYVSRFLVGFGGVGAFIVVPIYIAEISETQ